MYTPGLLRSPQPEPQLMVPLRMSWRSADSSSHTSGPPESPWVEETRLSVLGLGSALDLVGGERQAGPRPHLARIGAALQETSAEHSREEGGVVHVGGGAALLRDERYLRFLQEARIFLRPWEPKALCSHPLGLGLPLGSGPG